MLPFARIGLLIALCASLAACGGSSASGAPAGGLPGSTAAGTSPAAKASSPAAPPIPSANVVGAKAPGPFSAKSSTTETGGQASIEGTDTLQWQPNVILAKGGDKISLSVRNAGNTAHTILSPALSLDQTDVPTQKTTAVTFTAPAAPGAYQFWCNIPGHAEAGMVGEVIVQ